MATNKKPDTENPVKKLTENLRAIRDQIKINSSKLKEEYLKEKEKREKHQDKKIAKPKAPEADV